MMKKTAKYLVLVVVLLLLALFVTYKVRQSNAKHQLVDFKATSVLTIAVDDVILDNISSIFFSSSQEGLVNTTTKKWGETLSQSPGVSIPSRLFMFTLDKDPLSFYGILKVKNFDHCFSYFASEYPDEMSFLDKEKSLVYLKINPHIGVVFNKDYLVYNINSSKKTNDSDILEVIQNQDTWGEFKDFTGFFTHMPEGNLSYLNKDKTLSIAGDIKDNAFTFLIDKQLSKPLEQKGWLRDFDVKDKVLWVTCSMDLGNIPGLDSFVYESLFLANNAPISYFDLSIDKDSVQVNSTKIDIDYDQDFNEVQTLVEYTQSIPWIDYSFLQEQVSATNIAKNFFYGFTIYENQDFVLASTKPQDSIAFEKKQSTVPLRGYVDFGNMPSFTGLGSLNELQQSKAILEFTSEATSLSTIKIWGKLSWNTIK